MEAVDFNVLRERFHEALEDIIAEEDVNSTVITGWVLIFEGVHPEGERTLTVVTADASGEEPISPWQGEGYLHHVANNYDIYSYVDDDEDEESE